MQWQIEIKNYRCFSDRAPAVFQLKDEFTAIVGPNNSGKSTLLRMFYELRTLWGTLSSAQGIAQALSNSININPILGADDPSEIFNDTNDRPITITFTYLGQLSARDVRQFEVSASKPNWQQWNITHLKLADSFVVNKQVASASTHHTINIPAVGIVNVARIAELLAALGQSLYISAFRNAINEGAGNYYELAVGTGFVALWNNWKTGQNKSQMRTIQKITQDIQRIFGYSQLDISASQDDKKLIMTINDNPYKSYEVGAGLSQFVMVFGNAAIRKPPFVLIDEPELNLHPALQIDFLTSLRSYVGRGVMYTTHSIGLARSVADQIYCTNMVEGRSILKRYENVPRMAEFIGEMNYSVMRDLGFEKILLVEGVHDVKTIRQFLRKFKKEHQFLILPLGGDRLANDRYPEELDEIKRITNDIYAIVDSERAGADQPASAVRQRFYDVCKKLEFGVHLTQRRATENYFTDRAIKTALGDSYSALSEYETLEDCAKPWRKNQNWQIAAEMDISELSATDIGKFLSGI